MFFLQLCSRNITFPRVPVVNTGVPTAALLVTVIHDLSSGAII